MTSTSWCPIIGMLWSAAELVCRHMSIVGNECILVELVILVRQWILNASVRSRVFRWSLSSEYRDFLTACFPKLNSSEKLYLQLRQIKNMSDKDKRSRFTTWLQCMIMYEDRSRSFVHMLVAVCRRQVLPYLKHEMKLLSYLKEIL